MAERANLERVPCEGSRRLMKGRAGKEREEGAGGWHDRRGGGDVSALGARRSAGEVQEAGGDEEPGSELHLIYNSVCSYISATMEL